MSNRASRRRIERDIRKSIKKNVSVCNLTGNEYKLPTPNISELKVEKCYASKLGGCIPPISGEHYISKSILSQFDKLDPEGFPWLKGKVEKITPGTLTSNCLCKYHNEYLSPLDKLAGKFFANVATFMQPGSEKVIVWGPTLERWILKFLVGLVGAKQVFVGDKKLTIDDIPTEWLKILFHGEPFPEGWGLYMTPTVGQQVQVGMKFSGATLILDGELKGIRVSLGGFEFLLSMADPDKAFNKNHPSYNTILYKPRIIQNGTSERVVIHWEH